MTKYLQFDGEGTGPENVIYAMVQPQDPPLTPCDDDDPRYLYWIANAAAREAAQAAAVAEAAAVQKAPEDTRKAQMIAEADDLNAQGNSYEAVKLLLQAHGVST